MTISFYQREILYSCNLLMNVHVYISASALLRYDTVEHLIESNFPKWKNSMELCLTINEFDYALREDKPVAPAVGVAGYDEL
jgi:hypothetical protein